jgi:archaellum component FlaC
MAEKTITIDDLARMTQKGFNSIESQMARREEVNARFDEVDKRLDKIEKLILADYRRRIETLEIQVKEVRELLAIK